MDSVGTLLNAFEPLHHRKRENPLSLSKTEIFRWRVMRCQLEEYLFQRPRDPARDTREHLRVPVSFRVKYRVEGKTKHEYLTVLGEGGCFITTEDVYPVGSVLDLAVYTEDGRELFKVTGRVVWSSQACTTAPPEPGMGLRFIDIAPEQKQHINQTVDAELRRSLLETRRFGRMDVKLAVLLTTSSQLIVKATTSDLSIGGMFIECSEAIRRGETLPFQLLMPGGLPALLGSAEVVHAVQQKLGRRHPGYGLRFSDVRLEDKQIIRMFMSRQLADEGRAPPAGKRRHPRLRRKFKLRFQAVNTFGSTDVLDISQGGVFIQTREPPPIDSRMAITLVHPDSQQVLSLGGRVLRVVPADPQHPYQVPGIGIIFDTLDERKQQQLRLFLKDLILMEGPA